MELREEIARALVPPGEDPDAVTWFGTGRMPWWQACLPDADRVLPIVARTTPARPDAARVGGEAV